MHEFTITKISTISDMVFTQLYYDYSCKTFFMCILCAGRGAQPLDFRILAIEEHFTFSLL